MPQKTRVPRTAAPVKSPATRALEWLEASVLRGPRSHQPVVAGTLAAYGAREAAARIGSREAAKPAAPPDADELSRLETVVRTRAKLRPADALAIALAAQTWHRQSKRELADLALQQLETVQRRDGSFPDVDVLKRRVVAATYLEAHSRRVLMPMEAMIEKFPDSVADDDGRLNAIAAHVRPGTRVLEVGCGKGWFLAALGRLSSPLNLTGVDVAPGLLARVPRGVRRLEGALECIPCKDAEFDVTFSVEASNMPRTGRRQQPKWPASRNQVGASL